MWIYCLIGYLAISSSISYANGTPKANSTKIQDKRQTEHQTRIIQIGNQNQYLPKSGQHFQQQQQPQQQQQFTQEEIPADYLSLLQELQYQQSISPQSHPQYFDQPIHAAPSRSQAPQHPQQQSPPQFNKPSGKQQKVANIQYHLPSAPTKELQKPQQQQVIYAQKAQQQQQQQEPKFQYISEEEYLQLIKQQEQEQQGAGLAQYQTQPRGQPAVQHRPQKQPKFRPSPAPEHLQFVQPQQQEQLVQYRQRPVAAALQQQPPQQFHHFGPHPTAGHARPFGDSSFEKELQRIVESNKPVHYEQRPISLPQKSNARQHHKQGPFFTEDFVQPQPQPTQATRYVTPNVQSKSQQIQPSQKPKFESPASKYQLVVQPTVSGEVIYKNQQQQQQPQFFSYPKPAGQSHGPTKVKYYTQAKDKPQQQHHRQQAFPGIPQQAEFQEYLIANPTIEPQNYEAQANVMKIVDPPQLQFEKPTAAQLQQAKEYQQKAPSRSAQIQQSQQQNVPSKSQIFVTQSTGAPSASTPSSLSAYYEQQQAQQQQAQQQQQQEQEAQQYSRPENGENKLNIPLPEDRPLTQEEFQALVDAGFPVVPVPVPVPSSEYEKYAASPQITPRPQQAKQQRRQQNKNAPHAAASRFAQSQRPAAQSYNRYQQQADASSHSLNYLRPIDHFKSGLHGPQKINA